MAEDEGFDERERAAMRERAAEGKKADKRKKSSNKAAAEAKDVFDAISALSDADRRIAVWLDKVITAAAPDLTPRLWYGAPAYAHEGKVLCFFRTTNKDGVRCTVFGFQQTANLDDGKFWPTSFAVADIDEAAAKQIKELILRAKS